MAINQFFNPENEDIDNNLEVIVDKIVKAYSVENTTHDKDEKNDIIPRVRYFEMIKSVQKLWLYEEQQENRDSELIS